MPMKTMVSSVSIRIISSISGEKFVAEGNMDGAINNRADTPINFPIIRLADVYLMLAECYNQNGKRRSGKSCILYQ